MVTIFHFWSGLVGGFRALFSDRKKLMMSIGGVTALAAGVYTTRFVSMTYTIMNFL
jgi:ATPase family AAA domain-containing protein 3A/B